MLGELIGARHVTGDIVGRVLAVAPSKQVAHFNVTYTTSTVIGLTDITFDMGDVIMENVDVNVISASFPEKPTSKKGVT
jgi:hypothetical protein